ncbi:PH domain-containing protein [Bacillus sp. 123MFChir2]|uniref:PH domain-containing protein n=1 Tax=Bacillus sp. 123MFChir2 TaxID=1169144 RepID=UPI0003662E36|nr:PH domain-containing protein [Bacillus sp. 123MFChir2]
MKFKVKQNPFHMLMLLIPIFFFIAMFFIQEDNNVYLSCMILLNIINLLLVARSTYTITDKSIIIKYYFTNTEIPFKDIQHMKYYGKSLNSKKWTRRRLEIAYGLFDILTVCVPQEEEKFISLLKEKCPTIRIINKPANE